MAPQHRQTQVTSPIPNPPSSGCSIAGCQDWNQDRGGPHHRADQGLDRFPRSQSRGWVRFCESDGPDVEVWREGWRGASSLCTRSHRSGPGELRLHDCGVTLDESDRSSGGGGTADQHVAQALKQLTKIAQKLTEPKEKKNWLDSVLDGGSGAASSSSDTSGPSARRNAAAVRALQKSLTERPTQVYQAIEANLQSDYLARPISPGEPFGGGTTTRGWLVNRSRLQQYVNHVRWSWQVCGIWDALVANKPEEARARCAVLIAASDQSAIDGGNWLLASSLLLEPPPPYQSFALHQPPTIQELQHTTLVEGRWIEVLLGHLKEVEGFIESKRIEARRKAQPDQVEGRGGCSEGQGKGQEQGRAREGQDKRRRRSRCRQHQHRWNLADEKAAGVVSSTGPSQPEPPSQSEFIRVPGATASTYSGRAVIQSLFRSLRRGRCRLSGYARSFAALRFDHQIAGATNSQEMFPIPLPYPEIFEAGRRMRAEDEARKKGATAVLIILNYLHRDRPREAKRSDFRSLRPSREQWAAIRRLEHLMGSWIDVSLVGPEEMARTAGKVETLEATLRSLEARAVAVQQSQNSYFVQKEKTEAPGDLRLQKGVALGLCGAEGMTTFKPIDPSRLSFISRPAFDPSPYLDPVGRRIYQDPLGTRMPPEDYAGPKPHLRVHASAANKVKLFELLDASGRLGVHVRAEVTENFGSGMFSITKDLVKDRLILDSRGANLLECPTQRWIRTLAGAEVLTKLQLPDRHVLLSSGNDLRDFYYLFSASESRSRRNVLVGEIATKSIAHLHAVKQCHLQSSGVFCSMATLAMGDCQAVELAQTCCKTLFWAKVIA